MGASDACMMAPGPRAAGTGMMNERSFFHCTFRIMLKPQICARPGR